MTVALILSSCGLIGGGGPPPDLSRDPGLVQAVQARLAAEPMLDASRIRVDANAGVILLYGSVRGIAEWQCAIRNAELVDGVTTVVDYLIIERGPRSITCGAARGTGS